MNRHRDLERLLREERPRLAPELRHAYEARIARRTPQTRGRLLAGALVAGVTVAVTSVGGLGYAASGVKEAATSVKRVFVSSGPQVQRRVNAGGDQYKPGFGFGDPKHNHEGPPGLEPKKDQVTPAPRRAGGTIVVSTSIVLSEQAVLYLSVVAADGRQMVISQAGSTVGGEALSGPPAKTVRFVVLVPRAVDISLAVPLGASDPGDVTIRVTAVDIEGNRSTATTPVALPAAALKSVVGSEKADRIAASNRSDEIATGAGSDVIATGGGNDTVKSGTGNDTITALSGNKVIDAGSGNDRVKAGRGSDRITGGTGRDVIDAGRGNDTINTRDRDRDLVNGGPGRDTCIADRRDLLVSCEIVRVG